jgi:hypothetical protein
MQSLLLKLAFNFFLRPMRCGKLESFNKGENKYFRFQNALGYYLWCCTFFTTLACQLTFVGLDPDNESCVV